jgi:hypothetical protein
LRPELRLLIPSQIDRAVRGKRNLTICADFSQVSASFRKAFEGYRWHVNIRFLNRRRCARRTANEVVWIEKVPTILERCTLVNLSETGARLTIGDVYDLPERVALHLTRESDGGRQCQIIWRQGHEVGVEFLSESPLKRDRLRRYPQDDPRAWRPWMLRTAIGGVSGALGAATVAIANLLP